MANAQQNTDPFAGLTEAVAERAADILEARLKPLLIQSQTSTLFEQSALQLMHVYTAKEVAVILNVNRKESIYEIPEQELPRVRRIGKHFGYLGINVLCYMHNLPPIDMHAAIEGYRHRLTKERSNVIPLRPQIEEKNRVL